MLLWYRSKVVLIDKKKMSYPLSGSLRALKMRTGYNIEQVYGQRKTGPPPFWKGPPPLKGCEIFIGKIPRNVFEDELFPLFQIAGVIYEFRLMMEFNGENRGFAFVNYTNKTDALRAITLFDKYEIRSGHRIGVMKSTDNCRLYIAGLPTDKSRDEIHAEISKYTPGVVDVIVYGCSVNRLKNRGFAYVEYESHRAASMARKVLIPEGIKLFNCETIVDWPARETQVDDDATKSIWNTHESNGLLADLAVVLCVRNIPPYISEGHLLHLFSFQGNLPILKVNKVRDIAYVYYFARQDAETALTKLNGFNLSGFFIEVTLVNPLPKLPISENNDQMNTSIQTKICTSRGLGYCSKQSQFDKSLFEYNPVKLLYQVCQAHGWGEPIFYIVHTCSAADESEATFTAKVFIPNLPHPMKFFSHSATFVSHKDAKQYVAEYALRNITSLKNLPSDDVPTIPVTQEQNSWSPKAADQISKTDLWINQNLQIDSQSSIRSESLDQDPFYNLLASAASLANVQLQSKMEPDQILKSY